MNCCVCCLRARVPVARCLITRALLCTPHALSAQFARVGFTRRALCVRPAPVEFEREDRNLSGRQVAGGRLAFVAALEECACQADVTLSEWVRAV